MYTIKRVVQLVGLPSDTIRAWERRYGVPSPERSASGYRLYSAEDVSLLSRMRELVESGMSPSQAAAQLRELPSAGQPTPDLSPDEFVDHLVAGQWPQAELASFLRGADVRDDLAQAADEWLMPLLVRVGQAWARGEISLLQEHAVSATVVRQLAMAYEDAGPQEGPHVLVGMPTGATHEIGVMLFAVLLRRAGVDARYLGTGIAPAMWLEAAAAEQAVLAITACHRTADLPATLDLVATLREQAEGVRVAVGGRLQDSCPGADHLGHSFVGARRTVLGWLDAETGAAEAVQP